MNRFAKNWKSRKKRRSSSNSAYLHIRIENIRNRLLRFEDSTKLEEPRIKVYNFKKKLKFNKNIKRTLQWDKNHEANFIKKGKYDKAIRQSTISEQIINYLMLNDSEYATIKTFKSNFGGIIDKFYLELSEW